MTMNPRLWLSLGVIASLSAVLLVAAGRAAPPRSEREAVMAVLDQRAIAYSEVQVLAAEPGLPQDHFAYVAAVVVEVGAPAYGKIECLSSAGDCALWLEAFGIEQVALPRPATTPPWAEWLTRALRMVEG